MHLDSCRELKATLRERLAGPWAADLRRQAADAERRAAAEPPSTVALGVTRAARDSFRLAVRVQRGDLGASPVVGRIVEAAAGEADVRVTGPVLAQVGPTDLQARVRPLRPGLSVAHPSITAGTLGCFVETADGRAALLSNNHVIAAENAAAEGDPVLQPAPADGGADPDRVATLEAFVPLVGFVPEEADAPNRADAAIATIDDGVAVDPAVLGDGQALTGVVADLLEADAVEKVGRTTGHTRGRVTAFEVDGVSIGYSTGALVFDDLVEVAAGTAAFSEPGDSGSLIYTADTLRGWALLMAGSSGPDAVTYGNPLPVVLATLGVSLRLGGQ